jgi:hypothetical protein
MFRYITHPFATRHQGCPRAAVRLACVKHAASVQSEPGSNSSVQYLFWSIAGPVLLKVNHLHDLFRLCVSTTIFLKSFPDPEGLENFPKTKHLHSSVVCLFFKERLTGKTAGQRRGAHYRDGKVPVNTFLSYFDNNSN